MNKLKYSVLALLIFSITLLTGCWDYQEIENLFLVNGVAIDEGKNGSGYHLTFDTIDITVGKGKTESPVKSKLIETNGNTVFDAMRNTIKISGKKLYFADCRIIVISNQIASKGIAPVLDLFNRQTEIRIAHVASHLQGWKHKRNPTASQHIVCLKKSDVWGF